MKRAAKPWLALVGTDAKNIRFGFIADEMERVLPEIVRSIKKAPGGYNTTDTSDHPKNTTADNETTKDNYELNYEVF